MRLPLFSGLCLKLMVQFLFGESNDKNDDDDNNSNKAYHVVRIVIKCFISVFI